MITEDTEQIYFLDARSLPVRIGLIVLLLLTLAFGWFAVRWQIGNLLADITTPSEPNAARTANIAIGFAPNDPLTNWLLASAKKESDIEYTEGFENVIKLAPNDYRWWIQLGRAYEQAEKSKEAEKAFKKAVELAPNYTFPHWQLGNFYLRQDRADEAFKEMKIASESNFVYREQVFSIVWDYFEKDTEKLESIIGDSPDVRASLAKFYAAKEYPLKSLEMWNKLSPQEKQKHKPIAEIIALALYSKRYMLASVEFINQLGIEKGVKADSVYNGSFENDFNDADKIYFGWKVVPMEKMNVSFSRFKKQEGKRSLQINFNGFDKIEINNLYQTIAVKPNAKYELSFWLKTENLKSGGTPKLDVVSGKDSRAIASTELFAAGTNDWKQYKLSFTVPEESEEILLRTSRGYCGDKCPIFGTMWYDNFKLEKISGE